jgi:LysM repeat protein
MTTTLLRNFITVCCLFLGMTCFAQNTKYEQYIETYKEEAVKQMHKYGIPASITLAQGLLESGGGSSLLAIQGNNHFGIKVGGTWTGKYMLKDDDAPNEKFRVYDSPLQSYEDHSLFLKNGRRYASLFSLLPTDYKGWAHGLKQAGYATNPNYGPLLIKLIERYNLQQYDTWQVQVESSQVYQDTPHNIVQENSQSTEYRIHCSNNCYYILAHEGDTYQSLGKNFGKSARRLRKNNEVDKNYQLKKGDIVYLTTKKRKADKSFDGKYHIVKQGESLYTIAQIYGIKVNALYRANRIVEGFRLVEGQYLRIR